MKRRSIPVPSGIEDIAQRLAEETEVERDQDQRDAARDAPSAADASWGGSGEKLVG
jgi:hypothetical protein